jgi:hypothetical protein
LASKEEGSRWTMRQ